MDRRIKLVIGTTTGIVLAGGIAAGVAVAAESDAADVPLTGTTLERASEAALAETGGGEVVDSEVDEEQDGYEVEVDLDDGRQIEVHLDQDFAVVGSSENEKDDGDDD